MKNKRKPGLRLPQDFIWQLLNKVADDISEDEPCAVLCEELKKFRSIVRNRDVEQYISCCKNRWALNKLDTFFVPACRSLGLDDLAVVHQTRLLRCLTIAQKFQFKGQRLVRMECAIKIFHDFEKLCKKTNHDNIFRTFQYDNDDWSYSSYDEIVTRKVMIFAQSFIQRVLGSELDFEEMINSFRHGPGATTDKRGNKSTQIEKTVPPYGVTPGASAYFTKVIESDDLWMRALRDLWIKNLDFLENVDGYLHPDRLLQFIDTSEVTFVPKDAEKERTINIEPTANIYLQLGVDAVIRKNLKKLFSIDINTQEKNQQLAKVGSLTGKLVTIDLSGASDSVALTWLNLFPEKWAEFLLAIRLPQGRISLTKELIKFEKLSTMGNGFTFAIETLIFSALLYGTIRARNEHWSDYIDTIAIYGDDIVIPTQLYSEYSYVLRRLGFLENVQKTFGTGNVRESCGTDFLFGYRIDRPTIKCVPQNEPELVVFHNYFYDLTMRYGIKFHFCTNFLLKYINQKNFGPYDPNDMNCWLFSELPDRLPIFVKDYQAMYFKLKRNIVTHPCPIGRRYDIYTYTKDRCYDAFLPLFFYNRQLFREDRRYRESFHDSVRSKPSFDAASSDAGLRGLFFIKKRLVIRSTVAYIPAKSW